MHGKITASVVLVGAALLTVTTSALADFRVCNRSSNAEINVAYGHQTRTDESLSEGWWRVRQGDCVTLIEGPLRHRYYYLYGESGNTMWEGDKSQESGWFCTKGEKFTLPGDMDCGSAGYDAHKFIEDDTGDNDDFTHNLSD